MDSLAQHSKDGTQLPLRDGLSIFLQVPCMHKFTAELEKSMKVCACAIPCYHIGGRHYTFVSYKSGPLQLQVCNGVRAMHRSSFAHGDIKPHNVLVRRHPSGQAAGLSSSSVSSAAWGSGNPDKDAASEAEPLQQPDTGNRSSYHAVLMVKPFLISPCIPK